MNLMTRRRALMSIIKEASEQMQAYWKIHSQKITLASAYSGNMQDVRSYLKSLSGLSGTFMGYSYMNEKTTGFVQNETPLYYYPASQAGACYAYRYKDGAISKVTSLTASYDCRIPAGTELMVYTSEVTVPTMQ